MDLSAPLRSLFPSVDSDVLSVLAGSTKPRTGREVSRLADRSQAATQRVLDRLVDHGIVLRTDAGRSRVYQLNRGHLAAEPIEELASLRQGLFGHLRHTLGLWEPMPLHLSIFGSAARGDGGPESDIDIFLVRPRAVAGDDEDWRRKIDGLAELIFQWTGNHAGIAEVGEEELERLRRERPAIVGSLLEEAVDIAGVPVRQLLRRI